MNTSQALVFFDRYMGYTPFDCLPKKMKDRWLEALRSGEFVQGEEFLCVQREGEEFARFCCLGVAAHIFERAPWEEMERPWGKVCLFDKDDRDYAFRGGLRLDVRNALTILNDSGATFEVIANVIEQRL